MKNMELVVAERNDFDFGEKSYPLKTLSILDISVSKHPNKKDLIKLFFTHTDNYRLEHPCKKTKQQFEKVKFDSHVEL